MINTKLQSIIDTKSAIGNAIVNKGGTITSETPFFNYASEIDNISTGTPQTIFQASDGSKWARTNAVNLTNVSGNITSDFNWWQPANNGTSDPILNVGTVNANIIGNIRIVQVNQVNISQYVNLVANDTTGAKYVGYNGYDAITNPTPTGNATFNRWLLNNSASGTILFANAVMVNGGTYNGANSTVNESNLAFFAESTTYNQAVNASFINNGFVFVVGRQEPSAATIRKLHEGNLGISINASVNLVLGSGSSIITNNAFVYVGTTSNQVRKYHEGNLAFVGNLIVTQPINAITTHNGLLYVGLRRSDTERVRVYHESNLAFITNINSNLSLNMLVEKVVINNGSIFTADTSGYIQKYNLQTYSLQNTVTNNYGGGAIYAMDISNGFVYVGGDFGTSSNRIFKYHESNLAFVGNSPSFGERIRTIRAVGDFLYVGGAKVSGVEKYHQSNLTLLTSTNSYGDHIFNITSNNGFIYASGWTGITKKWQTNAVNPETLTFYTATKIKE